MFALALALAAGGCSFSYQLDSLFVKKDAADVETTGSIRPAARAKAASEMPTEGDLAHARAAVSEVLTKGDKDASMPWENPNTGARGTITPIAADLQPGRHDLPRLPGELRAQRLRILAAGRRLPRRNAASGRCAVCGRGRAADAADVMT